MKVKRPKTLQVVNGHSAAQLRRKWRSWIEVIARDVGFQLLDFDTFKKLKDIVAANPDIQKQNHLHEWIFNNYIVASSVALRRFDDKDSRSRSLWHMLYEMLEHPGVITKKSYRYLYPSDSRNANMTFSNLVGNNKECLGPGRLRRDLRCIEKSCSRIRLFVNKRVAHIGAEGDLRRLPTFGELDTALKDIDRIVYYYKLLLLGYSSRTQMPIFQYNWEDVLRKPWLPVSPDYPARV